LLDAKDLEILFTLQDEPLSTISSIAKRVNMSVSGTKLRLKRLEQEEKAFERVNIDLNLHALGLEIQDFFLKINSKNALKIIENRVCYYHPYIYYRVRVFGQFSGMYMQLNTPKGSLDHVKGFFDVLQSKGIIEEYEHVPRNLMEVPVRIKSAYKFWNVKEQRWDFNWKDWAQGFEHVSNTSVSRMNNTKTITSQLTDFDLRLLTEMMYDARQKNVDFIKKLKLNNDPSVAQKVSRRLTFLKNHAVLGYRIYINPDYFGLYQTVIIKATCSKNIARKLRNYILLGAGERANEIEYSSNVKLLSFPFQSVFYITEDGFIWYVRAPQAHVSELIDFVWGICPKHNVFWTLYNSSMTYALWHENFNEETKQWKSSKEYMIDNVIEQL
jgi:DNA-binding Lrp family transcriptional regulator